MTGSGLATSAATEAALSSAAVSSATLASKSFISESEIGEAGKVSEENAMVHNIGFTAATATGMSIDIPFRKNLSYLGHRW